ncbi:hypothetical protein SUGI_0457210 [Cryptomeria japonica]|nr:hypothetical protein SUGI_0457210 [Cryptomeria japonica]
MIYCLKILGGTYSGKIKNMLVPIMLLNCKNIMNQVTSRGAHCYGLEAEAEALKSQTIEEADTAFVREEDTSNANERPCTHPDG